MKLSLDFEEVKVTKEEWGDGAICSVCGDEWWDTDKKTISGLRFRRGAKAYVCQFSDFGGNGYLQVCQKCFNNIKEKNSRGTLR